jgi:hypothetical protein
VRIERPQRRIDGRIEHVGRLAGLRLERLDCRQRRSDKRRHIDFVRIAPLHSPQHRAEKLAMKLGLFSGRDRADVRGCQRCERFVRHRRRGGEGCAGRGEQPARRKRRQGAEQTFHRQRGKAKGRPVIIDALQRNGRQAEKRPVMSARPRGRPDRPPNPPVETDLARLMQ